MLHIHSKIAKFSCVIEEFHNADNHMSQAIFDGNNNTSICIKGVLHLERTICNKTFEEGDIRIFCRLLQNVIIENFPSYDQQQLSTQYCHRGGQQGSYSSSVCRSSVL